jgi:hypothetical protein
MLKRFCTTAQPSSRIARYINPKRNQELFQYQSQIKNARKSLVQSLKDHPTKTQAIKNDAAINRAEMNRKWQEYLQEVQSKLEQVSMNNANNHVTQKHHPCRPTVDHTKTEEQRAEGAKNLTKALRPVLVMRRKYLRVLWEMRNDFVTKENLDAKIDYAIDHPTNYNVTADRLHAEDLHIKAKLRAIQVPADV